MPLAPGRFSTSTGWPSRSVIFGPIRRAMMSVVLPGGNGTMILIGFEGQDCASAAAANPRANAASTTTRSCLILALPIRFRQIIILRAAIAAVISARARRAPAPLLRRNDGQKQEGPARRTEVQGRFSAEHRRRPVGGVVVEEGAAAFHGVLHVRERRRFALVLVVLAPDGERDAPAGRHDDAGRPDLDVELDYFPEIGRAHV